MERGVAPRRRCAAPMLAAVGFCLGFATVSKSQDVDSSLPSPVGMTAHVTAVLRVQLGPSATLEGSIRQVQAVQVPQPPPIEPPAVQPPPVEPPAVQPPPVGGLGNPLGSTAPSADVLQALEAGRRAAASEPSANIVTGAQALPLATADAGDLLGKALSVTGVETQKRSPIVNETRIRGYTLAQSQTHADGAFWFPARQDLDTFLSKIDSGIVRDIVLLKGPYSVRYGPGFAFIDIATDTSPRYEHGFEAHGRTLATYKMNGEQLYARDGIWAGSTNWGFRAYYGQRTGNDYRTGDDVAIPASYNSRDVDFAYGMDLGSPDNRIEFGYLRLDQTGLEFPGQIFDTQFLVTNGYRLRYTSENQEYFDRLTVDGWYNRTSLAGNAQGTGKRRQIPQLDQLGFTGYTDIDLASTGYRAAVTWGQVNDRQFTVGTDLRYLDGQLNEFDRLLNFVPCASSLNFPIPRSHRAVVGGLFLDSVMPVDEQLVLRSGLRGDWVGEDLDELPPGFCPGDFTARAGQVLGQTTDFQREFGLFMGYLTGEYKLNAQWTALGGFGTAQRPPTMTELYALQPFLAILQQGFTTINGNPRLDPERLYQIDIGLRADYERLRAGANGFYAFIEDYITYEDVGALAQQGIVKLPPQLTNAKTVQFVNTPFATLAGFEVYGEVDATDWLTPFMTMSFVEGRDHDRGKRAAAFGNTAVAQNIPEEPLPGIPPLETRLGLRLHEARRTPRWGVEVYSRVVDSQNRVAISLGEVRSSGFTIVDLRSFWQITPGILLTGGVENMFDKNYREHLDLRTGVPLSTGVFQPGINGYFGMEMRY